MHGIIHLELRKYVEARHGQTAWPKALAQAGIPATLGADERARAPATAIHPGAR